MGGLRIYRIPRRGVLLAFSQGLLSHGSLQVDWHASSVHNCVVHFPNKPAILWRAWSWTSVVEAISCHAGTGSKCTSDLVDDLMVLAEPHAKHSFLKNAPLLKKLITRLGSIFVGSKLQGAVKVIARSWRWDSSPTRDLLNRLQEHQGSYFGCICGTACAVLGWPLPSVFPWTMSLYLRHQHGRFTKVWLTETKRLVECLDVGKCELTDSSTYSCGSGTSTVGKLGVVIAPRRSPRYGSRQLHQYFNCQHTPAKSHHAMLPHI